MSCMSLLLWCWSWYTLMMSAVRADVASGILYSCCWFLRTSSTLSKAVVPTVMVYEEVPPYHDTDLAADGSLTVNIIFPATDGTIKRLMDVWWNVKVRVYHGKVADL